MRPACRRLKLRFTDNPSRTPHKVGTQLAPDHSNSVITCSDDNNKQHCAGVAQYISEQQLSLQNHLHPHPQGYKAGEDSKSEESTEPPVLVVAGTWATLLPAQSLRLGTGMWELLGSDGLNYPGCLRRPFCSPS